ncbi:MAG: dihydroorotase [Eubacterium sp.]|jgi:dihydroorotase|nr:dihydroorotase [Eubacterium sp.]
MGGILLKSGYIVDSLNNIEGKRDILVINDVISEIAENIIVSGDVKVVDCIGMVVIPGIFDMHVHLRDPGQTHKEDIFTGAMAAAAGGITGVLCMPNTFPTVDSIEIVEYIVEKAKFAKVKIYPVCSLTKGLKGEEPCDYKRLRKAGAVAASDDGYPVKNARMMYESMKSAHEAGLLVISHCEDLSLTDGGIVNEGKVSLKLGVKGVNRSSENIVTAREIYLAKAYDLPIHIAHVSTKEAVGLLEFNRCGLITAETAPHYFSLTEDLLLKKDADYRMAPPLRNQEDVDAIIAAVKNGVIDCIVTDHAPHSKEEKKDFQKAPNGVIGLETSLAATLTRLYHTGHITMKRIVDLMCVNPRKRLNISGGGLAVGDIADIAVFDPDEEWVVEPEKLYSKARNSCFKGMLLKGRVKYTIVNGKLVYEDERI